MAEKRSTKEIALEKMRELLLAGEIPRDRAISESTLLTMLQRNSVEIESRGPIREAMQVLLNEGFLEQLPNKRIVARSFSARAKAEIVRVRSTLEQLAALELAHQIQARPAQTEYLLAPLEDLVTAMQNAAAAGPQQAGDFFRADNAFHAGIADAADLKYLARALRPLQALVFMGGFGRETDEPYRDKIIQQHREILDAIRQGDADKAAAKIEAHILEGGRRWKMDMAFELDAKHSLLSHPPQGIVPSHQNTTGTNEDLLVRAQQGDLQAALTIAEGYRAHVRAFVQRCLAVPGEAEALIEETLLKAVRLIRGYQGECSLDQWILRLAATTLQERETRLARYYASRTLNRADSRRDAAGTIDTADAQYAVRLILSVLDVACTQEEACVLLLRYWECTQESIAQLLALPFSRVRTWAKNGQHKLLTYLAGYAPALVGQQPSLEASSHDTLGSIELVPNILADIRLWGRTKCLRGDELTKLAEKDKTHSEYWRWITHVGYCDSCRSTYEILRNTASILRQS